MPFPRVATGLTAAIACLVLAAGLGAQSSATVGLPPATEIVARHVEAIGGAEAYASIASIHARGTFSVPAQNIVAAFELYAARPNRSLTRVTVPGVGRIENGYDGTHGWTLSPISGPELLGGRQLTELAEEAWFDAVLHGPRHIREMETLEETVFDGRRAWKLRVVFPSGREQLEYFDLATGLQIGAESTRTTPQGMIPTVSILRDYEPFGSLLQATTFVQRALGFEQVVRITTCEYNTVDPASFDLPAEIAALVRQ